MDKIEENELAKYEQQKKERMDEIQRMKEQIDALNLPPLNKGADAVS